MRQEPFTNYNGNPPLMAARKLVAAAELLRHFAPSEIRAALLSLEPTNTDAMEFIRWRCGL